MDIYIAYTIHLQMYRQIFINILMLYRAYIYMYMYIYTYKHIRACIALICVYVHIQQEVLFYVNVCTYLSLYKYICTYRQRERGGADMIRYASDITVQGRTCLSICLYIHLHYTCTCTYTYIYMYKDTTRNKLQCIRQLKISPCMLLKFLHIYIYMHMHICILKQFQMCIFIRPFTVQCCVYLAPRAHMLRNETELMRIPSQACFGHR